MLRRLEARINGVTPITSPELAQSVADRQDTGQSSRGTRLLATSPTRDTDTIQVRAPPPQPRTGPRGRTPREPPIRGTLSLSTWMLSPLRRIRSTPSRESASPRVGTIYPGVLVHAALPLRHDHVGMDGNHDPVVPLVRASKRRTERPGNGGARQVARLANRTSARAAIKPMAARA
ncbi:MAG: hypothetical protein PVG22_10795 [Chromatiales bacterium]